VAVLGEHVHRPALALGVAAATAGQLGHDPAGIHAGHKHVTVVAIARDDRIARLQGVLDADRDRFLADVEMAEPTNQSHAVELPGPLLKAPDQQHFAIVGE
jgi:hypothetical protein